MTSEYIEVGQFLPHWQTGALLIVALIAGKIAYRAKVERTREKQNNVLKRAESAAQARDTLRVARQIDDVLTTVINNIDATAKLADTWIRGAQCFEDPAIRRRVASPPLFSVAPHLDTLGSDLGKTYLRLADEISAFRTEPTQASPSRLPNELAALLKIVETLQGEIAERRHQAQSAAAEASSAAQAAPWWAGVGIGRYFSSVK